jgi:hypothetical protein
MNVHVPSDIVARLRQTHPAHCTCFGCEAANEIERLRAERDEARREVCELQANEVNRLSSAVRLQGWICFEEKTEVGA